MSRLLEGIAALGLAHPRFFVAAAVALLVVCGALASTLTVDGSRHSMVSADHPHQALQMRYLERFGYPNTLVVVVSGTSADEREAFVDALEAGLEAMPALQGRVMGRMRADQTAELLLLGGARERPAGVDERGYLRSADGELHFVMIEPEIAGTQQAHEVAETVDAVRAARDGAQATQRSAYGRAPDAEVTGPAALVVDEEREIARGVATTSGVTGLAILGLLWLGFRSLRYALLGVFPVVLGVACTMAGARLIYGELNMVTSSCTSILLGLGIDFGVFLLGRYGELLRGGATLDEAVRGMTRKAGSALALGGVTTAVAFLTTTTTEFTAYARLGVIVSFGLFAMAVATLVLMPAMLRLAAGSAPPVPPRLAGMDRLPSLLVRGRWVVLGVATCAVVGSLSALGELRFNSRFYDFLPERAESARGLLRIEADPVVSPVRATVPVEGIEVARALTEALRALPEVASVQSPTDALPPLDLEALAARLPPRLPEDAPPALRRAVETAHAVVARGGYAPEDLPAVLQLAFVSRDKQAVSLQVVPAGDIWDAEVAARFAAEVSRVAPEATGLAMHISAHLRFIREGFTRAAGMAALLVLVLLGAAFRSVRDAALAFLPCAVGFVMLMGGMVFLDVPFDPANIVVLPLLLGIGVDAGVHLMHRVRESEAEHGVARLDDVVVGTGSAVALASVTTAAGFAGLLLADYGAMTSLGTLMTLGIGSCLMASLLVLPALLLVVGRVQGDPGRGAGDVRRIAGA